jgi:hypothetical protein
MGPAKEEDSQVAKKRVKAQTAKRGNFGQAMKVLEGLGVPTQEFGHLNKDGSVQIDPKQLEQLKKTLGKAAGRNVRFVALNAPFKRRSPTPFA